MPSGLAPGLRDFGQGNSTLTTEMGVGSGSGFVSERRTCGTVMGCLRTAGPGRGSLPDQDLRRQGIEDTENGHYHLRAATPLLKRLL